MLLLEAVNIQKYFGDRLIIEFDKFKIYSGDKIGIVGLNGSGKTTLMNILANDIKPDGGIVGQYCDITYIRQFSDEGINANQRNLKEFSLGTELNRKLFSGGEKTRLKLANAFSAENALLFADEPTANLDYKGIEIFKEKICGVETFLLISHDRSILDTLCNKILEIKDGRIKSYNGNYSFYKEQCDLNYKYAEKEYKKFVSEKTQLEEAIKNEQNKVKSMRKAPRRMGNSEARLHKRSTTQKQQKVSRAVDSMKTRLNKLDFKEKPRALPKIKLDFSLTNPPGNKVIISCEKLTYGYGEKKIFENAMFKVGNGKKIALWGENGTGKSTLLNLIKDNSNKSLYVVPKARIGYFHQGFENLDYGKSVLDNVMKDSVQNQTVVRTVLAGLLISGDNVYKRVEVLSGGEKIKAAFAKLLVSDANVLLLDEPTNYLDMPSIEALENVLSEYQGTVLFVSHDSALVNSVADSLFVFKDYGIEEFEGTLKEYESKIQESKHAADKETEQTVFPSAY